MIKHHTKNLTLTALFLAMGMVLPLLFGQIPQIGSRLLPMHLPVFLCAFLCERKYSVPMAILLPLLRTALFARPAPYPDAFAIAAELATYALVVGWLYRRLDGRTVWHIYGALIPAMLLGRVVRAAAQVTLCGLGGLSFSFTTFLTAVIVAGLPGVLLQLVFIPPTIWFLGKSALGKPLS